MRERTAWQSEPPKTIAAIERAKAKREREREAKRAKRVLPRTHTYTSAKGNTLEMTHTHTNAHSTWPRAKHKSTMFRETVSLHVFHFPFLFPFRFVLGFFLFIYNPNTKRKILILDKINFALLFSCLFFFFLLTVAEGKLLGKYFGVWRPRRSRARCCDAAAHASVKIKRAAI